MTPDKGRAAIRGALPNRALAEVLQVLADHATVNEK